MKKKLWRGLILCVLAAFSLSLAAWAAPDISGKGADAVFVWEDKNPARLQSDTPEENPADLFMKYLEREAGVIPEARLEAESADRLTGINLAIYNKLKSLIQEVAAGKRQSTVFEIKASDLSEFNLTKNLDGKDAQTVVSELLSGFDTSKIFTALTSDCPYDLYWSDRSMSAGYGYNSTSSSVSISFQFAFGVSSYYSAGENTIRNDLGDLLATVQNDVKSVVDANAAKSDYEKLLAYKEAICDRVTYNDDAAENLNDPDYDQNPWQLIYVFDKNPDTNVVCEGYAKAFQYLCDVSSFQTKDFACYLVRGYLSLETENLKDDVPGPHGWNHVTLNGKTYLIDVTNCDGDSAGAPNYLFMNPPMKEYHTKDTGYYIAFEKSGSSFVVKYTDIDMSASYPGSEYYDADAPFLTLSMEKYEAPSVTPTTTPKPTVTTRPTVKPTTTPKPTVTTRPTVKPTTTPKPSVTTRPTVTPTATPKPSVTTRPTATPTAAPTGTTSDSYRVNSITIQDDNGNTLKTIPENDFLATISVTNLTAEEAPLIVLGAFSETGKYRGLMWVQTDAAPGVTVRVTLPIENGGEIGELKAFAVTSFNDWTPLGNIVSFPEK